MANVNVNFVARVPGQFHGPRFGPGLTFVQRFLAIFFVAQKRSATTVRVDFNQPLRSKASTTVAGNYTITGPSAIVVSSVAFTPGNTYVVLTITGNFLLGTYTVAVAAQTVEAANEDRLYNAAASTDFIADAGDETAPEISDVTPAEGTVLGPNDPIGFRVTDPFGNLERTNVYAYFPRTRLFEVVFFRAISGPWGSRAEGFAPKYIGTREVVEEGADFLFSGVIREGGWPEPPIIIPDPIDSAGNEAA